MTSPSEPEFTLSEETPSDDVPRSAFPLWKKAVVGMALLLGLIGLALYALSPPEPEPLPRAAAVDDQGTTYGIHSLGPSHFGSSGGLSELPPMPGMESEPPQAQQILTRDWSTLLMKLGFSFLIGFSIGYALAFFFKLTALFIGIIALSLFGLQYVGLIEVNWNGMEDAYNRFLLWLQPHVGSFKDFITSNLSSSAMAAAGLFVGLRK